MLNLAKTPFQTNLLSFCLQFCFYLCALTFDLESQQSKNILTYFSIEKTDSMKISKADFYCLSVTSYDLRHSKKENTEQKISTITSSNKQKSNHSHIKKGINKVTRNRILNYPGKNKAIKKKWMHKKREGRNLHSPHLKTKKLNKKCRPDF